jgi:hypothetical protein
MKRVFSSVYSSTRSKKPRLTKSLSYKNNKRKVVSATSVHNYMNNDPLVDWLKFKNSGSHSGNSYNIDTHNSFVKFIMNKGNDFEKKVIEHINANFIQVKYVSNVINDESCKKTIDYMKQGVHMIHSAPVRNPYNSTHGIIDLLVRSDYINNLIDTDPLSDEEKNVKASKLNGDYHYVVVDIKFSTLPLRADGKHILNSGNYPAYKGQLYIYTKAVSYIQGYSCPYAFILGRRWKNRSKNVTNHNYSCLNRLGRIDYSDVDKKYICSTKKAIKWVRNVKNNGHKWVLNPPTCVELYPNMCKDSGKYNKEKQKIAEDLDEITSIWYLGVNHRKKAFEKGIKSWKDKRLTSSVLDFNGKRASTVDKILSINRQNKYNILPQKILNNINNWKNNGDNEVFVDFETFSDVFSNFDELPVQKSNDMIFMIGIGWQEDGKWVYENFTCKEKTYEEEFRIMDEFIKILEMKNHPVINYWFAENNFWKRAENRQYDLACETNNYERKNTISNNWHEMNWCDMYNIFTKEPIVLKGCFNFGLKNIAKSMKSHKMIETSLETNCTSGLSAMINANKCYENGSGSVLFSEVMPDIIKYNEFDCKVLWEIICYLRKNH